MGAKWKIVLGGIAIVVAFLAGFVPQFLQRRRSEYELSTIRVKLSSAQQQNAVDQIRTLAGRILLEASQRNYGTATEESATMFGKVGELAETTENTSLKSALLVLANWQDPITKGLAKDDELIVPELRILLEHTYDLPDATSGTRQNDMGLGGAPHSE